MFNIVCILEGSEFTGLIEQVEIETEWGYERTCNVYGRAGRLQFPKKVWKRTDEILNIESSVPKVPDDETN